MTTKIAVSLPDHLVSSARAAVADGRAASISAYVADALAYQSHRERLADILHDLDGELGQPSADDLEWADRELGINAE
jgi:Arc/MetJ-type ribon-helix-helix transcriptional regulator